MKQFDNFLAFMTGLFTGAIRFLLDANPNFPASLKEAAITALVCGAMGYLGKEIIVFIQKFIKPKNIKDEKVD